MPVGRLDVDEADFSITVEGTSILVKLRGELDMQTAPSLAECLDLMRSDTVVDCSGLDFMDSTGIRTFVDAHIAFEARGDHLVLRSLPPHARRILEITGVLSVLNVEQ